MNNEELALARILFVNKILTSEGNKFEQLFTQIMNYHSRDFEQIKPWGPIGDRKNDGFIRNLGIYYQVYAPEEIETNYPEVIKKLGEDFKGLLLHWKVIKEYYFVVNDKYKGVNADSNQAISKLVTDHNLKDGKILTAKNLEETLFSLSDDQIIVITGFLPDTNKILSLNYSALNEVIGYIMQLPIVPRSEKIVFPDWDEKLEFNGLSPYTKLSLNNAVQKIGSLNHYLDETPFLAQKLQKHLIGLYKSKKFTVTENDHEYSGDNLFWDIVKSCMPKNENVYEAATLTILSKYFESCDIFEEPLRNP